MSQKRARDAARYMSQRTSQVQTGAADVSKLIDEGVQFHQQGNLEEAETRYWKALESDPNNLKAWHLLTFMALQVGRHDAAEELANRLIVLNASYPDGHLMLGHALKGQGRFPEAIQAYAKCVSLAPQDPQNKLALANALLDSGSVEEAIPVYRKVLAAAPKSVEAWNNLGNALKAKGEPQAAIDAYHKALELAPEFAYAHYNLATALQDQGQFDEAATAYRQAIELAPDFSTAYNNLGNCYKEMRRFDEAEGALKKALELLPEYAEARSNLGNVLADAGQYEKAVEAYRSAIELSPELAELHHNLGNALKELGRLDEAIDAYQTATRLMPNLSEAHLNMGNAFRDQGLLEEAMRTYERAAVAADLEENAADAGALYNLGRLLSGDGRHDQALEALGKSIEADASNPQTWFAWAMELVTLQRREEAEAGFRKALELDPSYASAAYNLGNVLRDLNMLEEATAMFEHTLEIDPDYDDARVNHGNALHLHGDLKGAKAAFTSALMHNPRSQVAHSNLLFAMRLSAEHSPSELLEESERWAAIHAPAEVVRHNHKGHKIGKRIKVGYVSGDLRVHPVGYFMETVLENHDKQSVEVFCYANQAVNDEVTDRLKFHADHWRDILGLDDDAASDLINRDGIDVLVDLSGHTAHNRLGVFARKPAPVQMSWLGYNATTGMRQMDCIISDAYLVREEEEVDYVEAAARLPHTIYCFRAPEGKLELTDVPDGGPVFGCFSTPDRVGDEAVATWARLLSGLPGSKLLFKAKSFQSESARERMSERFAAQGIGQESLLFEGPSERVEFLKSMTRVHLILDTSPCNGGTTTVEALYMGVPVLTLRGDRFVGHVGESILRTAGLDELVALTPDDFVSKATAIVTDQSKLSNWRKNLRGALMTTTLFNGPAFARSLEELFAKELRSRTLLEREVIPH